MLTLFARPLPGCQVAKNCGKPSARTDGRPYSTEAAITPNRTYGRERAIGGNTVIAPSAPLSWPPLSITTPPPRRSRPAGRYVPRRDEEARKLFADHRVV
jgi:hypothetical protein